MSWQLLTDPELWKIISRITWHIFGLCINMAFMVLLFFALWHGWSLEIGKEGQGFHMNLEQYPIKRFFQ